MVRKKCKCKSCDCAERALNQSAIFLDKDLKSCISLRDGYQEYYGFEIGLDSKDSDKEFKIYRSSKTIRDCYKDLIGLPVTIDHVNPLKPVPKNKIVGKIKASTLVKLDEKATKTKVAVKNVLDLSDKALKAVKDGKKQLSLGYVCDTGEHKKFDLEQLNIEPHHLAIVDAGRCGDSCSFLDKKGKVNFMSLRREVEVALTDARSRLSNATSEKDMRNLLVGLKFFSYCDEEGVSEELDSKEDDFEDEDIDKDMEDSESEEKKEDFEDEEEDEATNEEAEESEEAISDKKHKKAKKDHNIKAMINQGVKDGVSIIEKARNFLPSDYDFTGVSSKRVMLDSLHAIYPEEEFRGSEIRTAFKLLKNDVSKHRNFGKSYFRDQSTSELMSIGEEEL